MEKFTIKVTEYRHVSPFTIWVKDFYAESAGSALDLAAKDFPYILNGKWNVFVFPEGVDHSLNTPESIPYKMVSND